METTTGVSESTVASAAKVFEKREQHFKAGFIDFTAGSLGNQINQFIMKFQWVTFATHGSRAAVIVASFDMNECFGLLLLFFYLFLMCAKVFLFVCFVFHPKAELRWCM